MDSELTLVLCLQVYQVFLYLLKTLAAPGLEGLTFYSDLEDWKVGGGSIPPEMIVASQRPDLVILDKRKTQTEIHLVDPDMSGKNEE